MRPHEPVTPQPQAAVRPPPSPLNDDRVRMGIYTAVLVAQIVLIYLIFAWWI